MAEINDTKVLAGNEALLSEQEINLPFTLYQLAEKARNDGCTVIYLAVEQKAIGIVALSDTLRPDALQTIESIHQTGIKTVLLTGDASQAANHMAQITGITDLKSTCLPEDKMKAITDYQNKGEPICMIGDGINDAPALKAAQVGIAMGGIGSDIAIEAADIALVSDDIKQIPHLLQLSQKTMHTININLMASMILNFIAILLAIKGILNPVVGALVHNIGSVAVIVNSSLLLKWRSK